MDDADLRIRNLTYELFVELGRAPSAEEASVAAGADVRESWARLHDAHALVLDAGGEIRMANPFAAVPTPYRRGRRPVVVRELRLGRVRSLRSARQRRPDADDLR